MYFKRNILSDLVKQIDTKEIVMITGMRRVGKTTLLTMIYEKIESSNKVFLDIENIIEQKIFEEIDYNNIWANFTDFGITNKDRAFILLDLIKAKTDILKSIKYI